ncbi:glycoside hydrolase family 10 protein [Coniophora puteana RWD-64-598 SS2]|uniref:Beta-xylanase n=1 Tax=Coniophora puteana (strain RWD-64-598) TaxID=741705 RepID=A0A5M3N1F9_CONPW|nr:glycoside hydrolase family 10 protein [Coniophora puteana RWD-64-598 SS2]EIW84711.1 glycoside hydrolase family 10 protein [Coniophora puteana RWD-64-598 SS2]
MPRFSLASLSLLLLSVRTALAEPTNCTGPYGNSTVGLNDAAKAAGKVYFGTATDTNEFGDYGYVTILNDTSIFGQFTPGNSLKWMYAEPEQGVFNFTGGDEVYAMAYETGKIMRGHNLVWYSELPTWVTDATWDATNLTTTIQSHVTGEVSHYTGKLYAWDVVNEPLNDNGTFRSDVFYDTLGSSYISIALNAARAADPNVKLYINEYNLEYSGPKIDAMVQLVKDLQAEGTPIDGIGFESHFILGEINAQEFQWNMQNITALGLEVAITELDDRIELPATAADLYQQQQEYQEIVGVCMAVEGCVGVTVWDYTDYYSWIPSTFAGYGAASPYNECLEKKPAYDGIAAAFTST